jgi:hypothetical protein
MKRDIKDRVAREAEFYDNARLQRDAFENALAYLNNGIGRRLIERNFEVRSYYSEMFTVFGAWVARPFFESPINPITRLCDLTDDLLVRIADERFLDSNHKTPSFWGEARRAENPEPSKVYWIPGSPLRGARE